MSIDGVMLAAVKTELSEKIMGGRIDKIYQPEKNLLTLTLRNDGNNINLLIAADPAQARIQLTNLKFDNPIKPPDFCMLLRKYLLRGYIVEIKQPDFERIITLTIKVRDRLYYLIAEIMGKYSNIILVNEDGQVLDAIKRITREISRERELYPGIKYTYPPKQDKLNPLEITREDFFQKIPADFAKYSYKAIMYNFRGIGPDLAREIVFRSGLNYEQAYKDYTEEEKEKLWQGFNSLFQEVNKGHFKPGAGLKDGDIDYVAAFPLKYKGDNIKVINFSSTGELFDYYYQNKIVKNKLKHLRQGLEGTVKGYLKKNKKKQKKLYQQLKKGQNAEEYKRKGELLKANLYQVKRGQKEIKVVDYYDPDQKEIIISLDPKLSPSDNVQRYFKKYNKAKKSVKHVKRQLGIHRHEEKYLDQVLLNIEQAETRHELKEIKEELKDEGYIKDNKQKKKGGKQDKPLPPYQFRSSEGYDILVGRNNRQNDKLTKKIANKDDIWLHIKELPGSHVIIRNHTGDTIPKKTLEEAAILAAYFSKGRMSENVPIDYTKVKHVNKPKGAKPGLVYYDHHQTLYVNPDEELVRKLKVT